MNTQLRLIVRYSCYYKTLFAVLLFLLSVNSPIKAQETENARHDTLDIIQGPSANNNWLKYSDAHYDLYKHLAEEAYDFLDKRAQTIDGLHSLSDWQTRQNQVKQTLKDIVGPFPEKTPLHAQVTKTVNRDGYKLENIIYQSQRGFYVTSTLFIPDDIQTPAPAVIYVSGHMKSYSESVRKQRAILNLVKKNFIVFAFDPIGQGERLGYYDPKTGKSKIGYSPFEHTYPGAQAFITGNSLAQYMIWDGIRAVDYLLTRKEVDSDRLGITGWSGGGMQTAYIAAFDDRIHAAAPERWITSSKRLWESMGPQDADQNLPGEVAHGIDKADFLEVRAPKPALMITTTRDFFSIQGSRERYKEVMDVYKAYGKKNNFSKVEDDNVHRTTKKNREAMYSFFQKYLDNPGSSNDEQIKPLSKEELQATNTGQIATSLDGETVFSLNSKDAKEKVKKIEDSRENLDQHLPKIIKEAKKLSGYREPAEIAEPIFTGQFQKEGYRIEKYFVEGEGDYPIPYLLLVPDKPNSKAVIYLDPNGKADHLQQKEWLARAGYTVLAPDLLGVGEMKSGDFPAAGYQINGVDYTTWFASLLIDRSVVGIQASDVVRLNRLLHKRANIKEVNGLAYQQMGPALLHAAAFDSSINKVALIKPYSSYRSIVMSRYYEPKFIPSTVAGALEAYDLPDLAASLAPRKLLLTEIRDGADKPADSTTLRKDTSVIKTAFRHKNAANQLKIIPANSVNNLQDLLSNWLK